MEIKRVEKNDDIEIMMQKANIKDMIEQCEECIVITLRSEEGETQVGGVAITVNPKRTVEMLDYLENLKMELIIGMTASIMSDTYKHPSNTSSLEEIAKKMFKGFPYPERYAEVYSRASKMSEEQ